MDSPETPVDDLVAVDYELAESTFKKLCSELEANVSMEETLAEVRLLRSAFGGLRSNEQRLQQNCGLLQRRLQADAAQMRAAAWEAADGRRKVLEMRAAAEHAFRLADEAHAREQHAQQALVTAEKQITLLRTDAEQTSATTAEKDGPVAKGQEEQKLEKDSLEREVIDLKTKLAQAVTAYDELERKNMATGAKVDTMAQHLEVLSSELGKEIRVREALESQQTAFGATLAEKEAEILHLHQQIQSVDKLVVKSETLEVELKATEDKMRQEFDVVSTKASKAQQEYEAQLIKVERLARESSQKSAALKARDEEVARVKQEAARGVRSQELHFKRLAAMEAVRTESERHKDELRAQIIERERETDRLRKQADALKKKLDAANRDKELLAKNISKTSGTLEQQVEKAKHMEQMEKTLRNQLHERDQELSKQKAQLLQLERECKKVQTEYNRKGDQCEMTCEELKDEQQQRLLARKQMLKLEFEQHKESALLQALRFDKENCERQLVTAKAKAERLEEKIQEMETKGVQLKESIISHEAGKMKDELVLQKAEREKESARHELRQVREQLTTFRERAIVAEQEQKRLQDELSSLSRQKDAMGDDLQKMNENQSALVKKLKAKESEVQRLRAVVKELEKQFQKANVQYEQRVEEIKGLQLRVQDLSNEKRLLTLDLNTRDDSRQHIFRLQRNLTEEQLKRKALEDELAQPRNIHRWRHLQGEDPERFELIQRLALVQKRMIYGMASKQKGKEGDERRLAVHSAPPTAFSAAEMLFQLRHSQKQVKGLMAEKHMYQSQADELRQQVHQLGLQLQESKKKLFAQKRRFKRSAKQPPMKSSDESGVHQRVRFTGGGFNLNVTPQDSRLSD